MFGKSPPLTDHVTSQKSLDQSEPFETKEIHANEVNITTWSGNPKTIILKLDLTECRSIGKNKIEMAAGRCSSDPTDLLLVDPSQPEATKRTRKHLTKRQKDTFIQYGFSKALL